MQKSKLDKFIQKYNLGGNVNSVKWKSSGDTISTSFVTPDKSLLGSVTVDKFQFEDAELGVYQTDQLKSLINVLGDDVSLDLTRFGDKAVSLKVKNGPVSVDYVLSDLSVISDPPQMKHIPQFGTQIKLDRSFIDTFIKGKGALSDVDTFSVVKNGEGCDVVIGYSSTNTNRVNIPTECETCDIDTFKWGVSDRGASIRIPWQVAKENKGYLEDRRPSSNCDPYKVSQKLIETICS